MSTIKLQANRTEKQNLIYLINEYIKRNYPGLASQELQESDVTFGNPSVLSGSQNYFNDHQTLLSINQDLDPNTEISVTITKPNWVGPKFTRMKYHRHNLGKTLPLFAKTFNDFYGGRAPNTVLTLTNNTDNKDKISVLINNHMAFIKENILHARYLQSENRIHIVFNQNSLLYKGDLKIATVSANPYVFAL